MKKNYRINLMVILTAALLAILAMSATAFADGEYTVHYESWGLIEYEEDLPADRTVSADATGFNMDGGTLVGRAAFRKNGATLNQWCTDDTLDSAYSGETAAELADENNTVTLYAKAGVMYEDANKYCEPWAKKDSLPGSSGNYYLIHDVTLNNPDSSAEAAWTAPQGKTFIWLCDHSITRSGESSDRGTVVRVPSGANLTLETLQSNNSILGGQAAANGGGVLVEGNFYMIGGGINNNTAGNGGGIAVSGSGSATLRSVAVRSNTAAENGGGIALYDNGSLSFTGDVSDNTAGTTGGGVFIDPNSTAKLALGYIKDSGWHGDAPELGQNIHIVNNKAGEEDSNICLTKDALKAGTQRIEINTFETWDGNNIHITLDDMPTANAGDDSLVLTDGVNNSIYPSDFNIDGLNGNYEKVFADTGSGDELTVRFIKYKVTYMNGSSEFATENVYKGGKAQGPENDPERQGADFLGWVDENGAAYTLGQKEVTKDITLKAYYSDDHFHDGHVYTAVSVPPSTPGYYYLRDNLSLYNHGAWKPVSGETHLCLNGKILQGGNSSMGIICLQGSGVKVHIHDCRENTGRITQLSGFKKYSPVYVKSGTFTLHGGEISGCAAPDRSPQFESVASSGGVTVMSGGTFNMEGGIISENKSERGGAVHVYSGTFNMSGGTISANSASGNGGGIFVSPNGTVNISGGTIYGNTASAKGGGVFVSGGSPAAKFNIDLVSPAKSIEINGNKADGEYNNVYLEDKGNGQPKIAFRGEGSMSDSTVIGVTSPTAPETQADGAVVISSGLSGKGSISNFRSDDAKYAITENADGEAAIAVPVAKRVVNGKDIFYASLQDAVNAAADEDVVYMLTDITLSETLQIKGKRITLNIGSNTLEDAEDFDNSYGFGQLINVTTAYEIRDRREASLTLTGNADGKVQYSGKYAVYLSSSTQSPHHYARLKIETITVSAGATAIRGGNYCSVTVKSGSVLSAQDAASSVVGAIYAGSGSVTVTGGTVKNENGAAVSTIVNGDANISGGSVEGSTYGIYSTSTGNHGAEVTGGVIIGGEASVYRTTGIFRINGGVFSDDEGNKDGYTRKGNMKLMKGANPDYPDYYALGVDKSKLKALVDVSPEPASVEESEDGSDVVEGHNWATPEDKAEYDQAYGEAQTFLNNNDATQNDVNTVTANLGAALGKIKTAGVDKTELEAALTDAVMPDKVARSTDGKDVPAGDIWATPDDWTTYSNAVNSAIDAAINAGTQDAVDKALNDFNEAKELLQTASVNKSALGDAITEAQNAEAGIATSPDGKDLEPGTKYTTPEEKQALDEAIASANEVLNNDKATQNQIDGAVTAVSNARTTYEAAIKEAADTDKSALEDAITAAQNTLDSTPASADGSDVDPSSKWATPAEKQALADAINEAKAVLDDPDATQAQIDSAVSNLAGAVSSFNSASKAGTKGAEEIEKTEAISEILDPKLPKPAAKKPAKGKKSVTAQWKKLSKKNKKKVQGIEVQVAPDKSFSTDVVTKTVKKTKAKCKVKKLSAKKTYWVRVRTYKYEGGIKHVSNWSKVKKVKTK